MEHGHIATNVLFNENTSDAINELISENFSLNIENNWIILNGSVNKLKAATSQVIIYYYVNQKFVHWLHHTRISLLKSKYFIFVNVGKINTKLKS